MVSDRTHVRVKPETYESMRELVAHMELAAGKGRGSRFWSGKHLTMAELVGELVARELAHRRRSLESSIRRKAERRRGIPPTPLVLPELEGVNTPEQVIDLSEPPEPPAAGVHDPLRELRKKDKKA